jgi:hypothetical protein
MELCRSIADAAKSSNASLTALLNTLLESMRTKPPSVTPGIEEEKGTYLDGVDIFRLLCTQDVLTPGRHFRRSRLLPCFNMPWPNSSLARATKAGNVPASIPVPEHWSYFMWKRLLPEKMQDWFGSTTPHYASQDVRLVKRMVTTKATLKSNQETTTKHKTLHVETLDEATMYATRSL